MKAVDGSKVAEKQFLIRIPGNCAELYGPFRNATRRMCFVGSSVGLRSTSVTRLESSTVWRQVAAADGVRHTLPAPSTLSTKPVTARRSSCATSIPVSSSGRNLCGVAGPESCCCFPTYFIRSRGLFPALIHRRTSHRVGVKRDFPDCFLMAKAVSAGRGSASA